MCDAENCTMAASYIWTLTAPVPDKEDVCTFVASLCRHHHRESLFEDVATLLDYFAPQAKRNGTPAPEHYRLVEADAYGTLITEFHHNTSMNSPMDAFICRMEARGYPLRGFNKSPYGRIELQGQPKFRGLDGPIWDGNAIRYECAQTYSKLGI